MTTLLKIYYEFFKIGLFSVGGGLATLPYLERLADVYSWFTHEELVHMIAISESTPGAIGINMATFAGFQAHGVLGGLVATLGILTPAIIVLGTIAKMLERFKENKYINYAFYGIRACVAALILSSCFGIMKSALLIADSESLIKYSINFPALIAFILLLAAMLKFKKHPIFYIVIAALLGLFIAF